MSRSLQYGRGGGPGDAGVQGHLRAQTQAAHEDIPRGPHPNIQVDQGAPADGPLQQFAFAHRLIALDHVHGGDPRRRLGDFRRDVGAVDGEFAGEFGLAVPTRHDGHDAGGRRLGLVVVQQLETPRGEGERAGAIAGEAHPPVARQGSGAGVLGGEAADGQGVVAHVQLRDQVTQLQSGRRVLEAAVLKGHMARELQAVQVAADGPLGGQVATKAALAAEEEVPDRLQFAVGVEPAFDGSGAVDGDAERRGRGDSGQHHADLRVIPRLGPDAGRIDAQLRAGQHGVDRAVHGQFRWRIPTARALKASAQHPVEVLALTADADIGVEMTGEVLAEGRQVDPGQHSAAIQRLAGPVGLDLCVAAADGQGQLGRLVGPIDAELRRLQGVEVGAANAAAALETGPIAPRLEPALAGPVEFERRAVSDPFGDEFVVEPIEGALGVQMQGRQRQRRVAERHVRPGQAELTHRSARLIDNVQPAIEPALTDERPRPRRDGQIGGRGAGAPQRQVPFDAGAAAGGVHPGQVHPVAHEVKKALGVGRSIGAGRIDLDRSVDGGSARRGDPAEGQRHVRRLQRQARQIDPFEIGQQIDPRRANRPEQIARAVGAPSDLDRTDGHRTLRIPLERHLHDAVLVE